MIQHPMQAARDLIRAYVRRGDSIAHLAKSRLGASGPEYTAGIGPSAGTDTCPGTPGFITVSAFNGKPCCHRFGLHQIYGHVRDETTTRSKPFIQQELFSL